MAMQSKLWSISGLATELGIDRRTLAKRLEHLAPAEEKKTDKRIQKLWRMSDVVEHLHNPRPQQSEIDSDMKELTKEYLSKQLFPLIADNDKFICIMLGASIEDGLSKQQSLNAYRNALLALASAFSDITEDKGLAMQTGTRLEFINKQGDQDFIKNYWPAFKETS